MAEYIDVYLLAGGFAALVQLFMRLIVTGANNNQLAILSTASTVSAFTFALLWAAGPTVLPVAAVCLIALQTAAIAVALWLYTYGVLSLILQVCVVSHLTVITIGYLLPNIR